MILFGAVQLTMFIFALRQGERFPLMSWAGLTIAILGLVYLVSPGVTSPDPLGAVLMAIAGIAWGFYSLWGRSASDPLEATARNFVCSVPIVLIVSLVFWPDFESSSHGLALAVASGAIASGCGYVIWYAALPGLTATRAATVQLSVPMIAAFGGVVMLSEQVTTAPVARLRRYVGRRCNRFSAAHSQGAAIVARNHPVPPGGCLLVRLGWCPDNSVEPVSGEGSSAFVGQSISCTSYGADNASAVSQFLTQAADIDIHDVGERIFVDIP